MSESTRDLMVRLGTKPKTLSLPTNLCLDMVRLAYRLTAIQLPDDEPTAETVAMYAGLCGLPRGALVRGLHILPGSLFVGDDKRTSCWLWFQSSCDYSGLDGGEWRSYRVRLTEDLTVTDGGTLIPSPLIALGCAWE